MSGMLSQGPGLCNPKIGGSDMSIIDDIQENNESADIVQIIQDGVVRRAIYTSVRYASEKGWYLTVRDIDLALSHDTDGTLILTVTKEILAL